MEDTEFDRALVAAVFEQAALTGWRGLSVVDAARAADLPLDRARARCPGPAAALMRFGLIADQAALAESSTEAAPRDQLFDLVMRRFDVLQQHRAGMLALLRHLPTDPALALALSAATGRSMGWMLEAAGVSASGLTGRLRVAGLVGVWLYTLRAWKDDESADLSGTMAALDKALDQAEKWAGSLLGSSAATPDDAAPDALITANPPPPPPETPPSSPPV
jgi:ubiquinone biosynthesis protein COQ9